MAEAVKATRRYDSTAPPRAGGGDAPGDPRGGPAALRARWLRRDDDGGDRRRGGRRAEDRLPRVRDQERPAARALAPAPARRRGRRPDRRAPVVPRRPGRARPRAPAAPERAQLARRSSCAPRTSCASMRDAAGADPDIAALWQRIQDDFYANQRAVVEPGRQGRPRPRPRRRPRRRHPLDAQPPRRLAPARGRARLERRTTTSAGSPTRACAQLLSRPAPAAAPAA